MIKKTLSGYLRQSIFFLAGVLFFACILYACASIGSPQGGPIDYEPPRFVSSTPQPNSVNYDKKRIEIYFDELVTLDKPMDKVIITPPQTQFPTIKAAGKKVTVEINDSLRPNTTYTIDFSDAIADNNEKNVLENFTFAFSTGEIIDSLVISGTLLNAENLEPMSSILVGLHENLDDSAFVKLPFFRTTKTNDRGQFWIRNIAPGSYKVYALNDLNRDYKFDQPGEAIAFYDSIIVPSFIPSMRIDTIWKDSLTVDTIIETAYNRFIPDDIVLFLSKEKFERQYMRKSERPEPYKFSLFFNTQPDTLSVITFLNAENPKDWAVIEYAEEGKTLTYWMRDSLLYNRDTLSVEVSYYRSDSLNLPVWTSDTLSLFVKRAPKKPDKKDKKDQENKIEFLGMSIEASALMDVFDSIKIKFQEPVLHFDSSYVSLAKKIDSITWERAPFSLIPNEKNPMQYAVYHKWEYGQEYRINIDSAVFIGFYGKWNAPQKNDFKFKKAEDYGNLFVNITGVSGHGFGELLDGSDKVVRKAPLKDGGLLFMNLKPNKYYLRYVIDINDNGVWDTGDYSRHRHPEQVYYYPAYLDIRENWKITENWDVTQISITKQKPLEITKNKPKEKKRNATTQNAQSGRSNNPNSRLIAPGM